MIYPKKNLLIKWFFRNYIKFIISKNFYEVNFDAVDINPNKAILLLGNHFSWWDGFILYLLNERLLHKKFHIMILEDTVSKVSFMKYMGAFSIKKGSRDVITSLNFAASLLDDPKNLVLIYPQGKIHSNFADEIIFENGLSKIITENGKDFQVLFAVTFIENFKHKKPLANVYLSTLAKAEDIAELQNAYQRFYDASKARQTQIKF